MRTWLALGVVYVVWGSTYLSIRVCVAPTSGTGLPPLFMAGVRFTLAGVLMLPIAIRRPSASGKPDPIGGRQWLAGSIVGLALLLGGNGLVSIGEQRIASGTAALVVASVPILTAAMAAALGRERFTTRRAIGLVVGLLGVAVLSGGGGRNDLIGILIVVGASASWSAGSVYAQRAPLPARPLVSTGIEMLIGGLGCFVLSGCTGEFSHLSLGTVPTRSWLALAYLVVFGSMVAYTAFAWLLANAPLSLTTTYAYVNPVVAVILGAVILGEPFTLRTVIAAVFVVGGIGLVITRREDASSSAAEADSRPISLSDDAETAGASTRSSAS